MFLIAAVIYCVIFLIPFREPISFAQFIGGFLLGNALLYLDRVIHVFFLYPQQEENKHLRSLWMQKRYLHFLRKLFRVGVAQKGLLMRSTLFFCAYIFLTLYVLTSTGSVIGVGMMLGIGFHLCMEMILLRTNSAEFALYFFNQRNSTGSREDVAKQVQGAVAVFIFFTLLVLITG